MTARLLLLVLVWLLPACGNDVAGDAATGPTSRGDGLLVVATTSIVGDIVANVVGDAGSVEVLLPRGADPHDFAPSAAQIALLGDADLVVSNGLGLEEGVLDALAAAEADGTRVFELASAYQRILETDGVPDPHIWFDPVQMAAAVLALGEELAGADDRGDPATWRRRARAYHDRVLAAHADVEQLLSAVPPADRTLVTMHDTMRYFAERYDLEVIGAAIPSASSTAGSSAAQLAELAEAIQREEVPAVFAENVVDDELMRTLAAEAGRDVQVVPLLTDSLAPPGQEGDSYVSLLRLDARRIADALSPGR